MAIVDLGTNTCRLFVADVTPEGVLQQLERRTTVVRLGERVDVYRRLQPEAIRRTRACLDGYSATLEQLRPERRLLIATSVLRDAVDGAGFLASVESDVHLPSRVLSGEEEAALAFCGGTAGLAGVIPEPLALIDIGGGSTEFAIGSPGQAPDYVRSLDIGAVRLTERFISHDPPEPHEVAELRVFAADVIGAALPLDVRAGVRAAVGVAGTFATLAAYKLELRDYRSELVHGHVLSLDDMDAAIERLGMLTSAERGRLPGIQPGREDVILAGAIIAREACVALGLEVVRCSEADLLEGAALALADGSL